MDNSALRLNERKPLQKTSLILLMGVPASGKTTMAKEILKRIWAIYLDNNFIADAFFSNTRTDPQYLDLRRNLYDVLYRITEENLMVANSVLLDVPHVTHMQDDKWRVAISERAARCGANLIVIRCFCSEETLHRRISARAEERDRWKLENWPEFVRREPLRVPIPFPHLEIDTEESVEGNAVLATRYILQQSGLASGTKDAVS